MSETPNPGGAPTVKTSKADTYKEIYVTGQIANLTYDGLRLAVLHDAPDLTNTVGSDRFDASKMVIDRKMECTLMLSPMNLKAWTIVLQKELAKYEKLFGTIPPPEAVRQKFQGR